MHLAKKYNGLKDFEKGDYFCYLKITKQRKWKKIINLVKSHESMSHFIRLHLGPLPPLCESQCSLNFTSTNCEKPGAFQERCHNAAYLVYQKFDKTSITNSY